MSVDELSKMQHYSIEQCIYMATKSNDTLIHATNVDQPLKDAKWKCQIQKVPYGIIQPIWNVQKRKIHIGKKYINISLEPEALGRLGWWGLRRWGRVVIVKRRGFLFGVMKNVVELDTNDGCTTLNPKNTKVYTLKLWLLW